MAVKGTSFGVGEGECFALLGVNGAGKSTTFNCITGYDVASGGQVLLDGVNVNNYYKKPHLMHKIIGYCP
jgi:ABC-type multidrug transport system ATPase subunit